MRINSSHFLSGGLSLKRTLPISSSMRILSPFGATAGTDLKWHSFSLVGASYLNQKWHIAMHCNINSSKLTKRTQHFEILYLMCNGHIRSRYFTELVLSATGKTTRNADKSLTEIKAKNIA